MKKIKDLIKQIDLSKLKKTGFFSIFISTVFSKVLVFFGGIIVVRVLSKSDYGTYAYVLNVIAVLSLLNDFGASSASMQFMLEKHDDKAYQGACLKYALRIGMIAGLVSSILLVLSPVYYPYKIDGAEQMTLILTFVPILTIIYNFIPVILRVNIENKKYGIYQFGITFINYAALIGLSLAFGLIGAIISNYLYYVIIIIWGVYLIKKYLKKMQFNSTLDKKQKSEFLKFSLASQINNTIGGLLIIIDTFLVGLLIASSESVATYKVGSAIPHALSFLPTCVVIYIMPYFIKNNKNFKWIWDKYKSLIKYGSLFYGLMSLSLIILSKPILYLLYGSRYYDSIPIFIFLIISFFFSATIKIPCSNITYSLRKVKFNIIINIICIVLNAISNYIFIKLYGAVGAAITTMIISIVSSIAYLIYINKLMRKAV